MQTGGGMSLHDPSIATSNTLPLWRKLQHRKMFLKQNVGMERPSTQLKQTLNSQRTREVPPVVWILQTGRRWRRKEILPGTSYFMKGTIPLQEILGEELGVIKGRVNHVYRPCKTISH